MGDQKYPQKLGGGTSGCKAGEGPIGNFNEIAELIEELQDLKQPALDLCYGSNRSLRPLVFCFGHGASPEVFVLIAGSEGFDVDLR